MNELDSRAWRAFHRIGSSLLPYLGRQVTCQSGLSESEYIVLLALSEMQAPTITLNGLANQLGWEISRISHLLSRMCEGGLVAKRMSDTDARCQTVGISDEGRRIITSAVPLQSRAINHCFSDVLSPQQKEALIEIADAVVDHMALHHPPKGITKQKEHYDCV